MKINRAISLIAAATISAFLTTNLSQGASAEEGCGFGNTIRFEETEGKWVYNEKDDNYTLPDGSVVDDVSDLVDEEGYCAPTTWLDNSDDDGFGSQFRLIMWSDDEGFGANSFEALELICHKKRLSVHIWADFPITRGWSGTGRVRIDSGKAKNFAYKVNSRLNGLYLTSPKAFTKSLLAAKTKATFKINTYGGTLALAYPKADLETYSAKFAKRGCRLD